VRTSLSVGLVAALTVVGCNVRRASQGGALGTADLAAIQDSVRTFAADVARGVTTQGPGAWRRYFADEPAFFMASEGHMVFPTYDSASRVITGLIQAMPRIELRWSGAVRVDPLGHGLAVVAAPYHETQTNAEGQRVEEEGFFTGVAEHRSAGWQFRDAHWSVAGPPSGVR